MSKDFKKELLIGFLFNLVFIFMIAISYIKYIDESNYFLAKFYIVIATFSHFVFLFAVSHLFSILSFFINKGKVLVKIVFIVSNILFLVILKLDSMVFDQFRYHLSPFVFKLVFGKNSNDIFDFSSFNLPLIILGLIIMIVLQLGILFLARKIIERSLILRIRIFLVFFMVSYLLSHVMYAWADATDYKPITRISIVYPLYHPLTAKNFLDEYNIVKRDKKEEKIKQYKITSEKYIKYPLSPIVSKVPLEQKNIIFLVIDSWRFDCMDSIITPNIHKLSKKSQVYKNHFSGSNGTSEGIFSLFYGIGGLYYEPFTRIEKSPAFIDELINQGYELDILGSATLQNPSFDKNVFSNVQNLRMSSTGDTPWKRDAEITSIWLERIKNRENSKAFFSFLFYDAAHGFDSPEEYNNYFTPSLKKFNYLDLSNDYKPERLINKYKNALHFIDNQIGLIINQLKQKGLLESTIIVVTGDHGQEFNDNQKGYWMHGGNYSEYQIKIPFILFDSSMSPKYYNKMSLHYDVVPTIMNHYLGVLTDKKEYSIGDNLFDLRNRDWFVSGSNNNYAILERDRITTVYPSGFYNITDLKLNDSKDMELNYQIVYKAFREIKKFDTNTGKR